MKRAPLRFAFLFLCAAVSNTIAQTAPVITSISGPRQVVKIGQTLTLGVAATGAPAPTYQWKRNGRLISGATSQTYTIANASPIHDNGWYQIVAANGSGTTTSAVVFVNVDVYPAQILTAGNYGATPSPVPEGLTKVVAVSAGAGHWLALKADGTVAAWGFDVYGQATVPANLTNVVEIAAGNVSSYALKADGTVVAWGDNSWKQTTLPAGLSNVVSIAAGQSHALALRADGTVVGWGWNQDGQASPPPQLNNVVSIAAGENNSFAVKADGTAVVWGNSFAGNPNVLAGLTGLVDVASGEDFSIALTIAQRIIGWAAGYSGTGIPPDDWSDVVGIAAGLWHALALRVDGTVVSWGETYTGPAVAFENATNVVAIDAKDAYSVALRHSLNDVIVAGPSYTFTTLAGQARNYFNGSVDGTGTDARFGLAAGIAVDGGGNVYVADYGSHTIRKVTPSGVVTTLAGTPETYGGMDGIGSSARFTHPTGVSVHDGIVFVADAGNGMIRKVTANGVVTTLAGNPVMGSADGTGHAARFEVPNSIAVDSSGNVYVADAEAFYLSDGSNNVVRKITPNGVVTTLAGSPGSIGANDGAGATAQFSYGFSGIALDNAGNVYVADTGNHTIRKITPNGTVTTVAGKAGNIGIEDGPGSAARFHHPSQMAMDRSGNIFVGEGDNLGIRRITPDGVVSHVMNASGGVVDYRVSGIAVDDAGNLNIITDNTILKGVPVLSTPSPVTINSRQPKSQTVAYGGTAALTVQASGSPAPTFQWTKDGTTLPGATNATLIIPAATAADAGNYLCLVTNQLGTVASEAITLTLSTHPNPGRLINLSSRAPIGAGAQTMNLGFVVDGWVANFGMPILLRAVGPSLAPFDVPGFHADPTLEFYAAGEKIDENDDWGGDPAISAASAQVGAFPFVAAASEDAALYVLSCVPGLYTAVLSGPGDSNRVVLAEVYDANTVTSFDESNIPRLINSSARAHVGLGNDVLIAGFVISGHTSMTLLVRAIGPSLAAHGVDDLLADPKLQLFSSTTKILENDDWSTDGAVTADVFAGAGAFAIPSGSKDAALLVTLPPGAYTAHVSGADGGTGVALVEIFVVP